MNKSDLQLQETDKFSVTLGGIGANLEQLSYSQGCN